MPQGVVVEPTAVQASRTSVALRIATTAVFMAAHCLPINTLTERDRQCVRGISWANCTSDSAILQR